jgi:hypothetical protein
MSSTFCRDRFWRGTRAASVRFRFDFPATATDPKREFKNASFTHIMRASIARQGAAAMWRKAMITLLVGLVASAIYAWRRNRKSSSAA